MKGGPFCTVDFIELCKKKGANAPFFVGYCGGRYLYFHLKRCHIRFINVPL